MYLSWLSQQVNKYFQGWIGMVIVEQPERMSHKHHWHWTVVLLSIFHSNQELLQAIKRSKNSITIHCGGTIFDQTMIGWLRDKLKHLPLSKREVCVAKDGIANLLSMRKLLKEGYRVQMDSDVENAINVFNEGGSYIKFVWVNDGLYCINLDDSGGMWITSQLYLNRSTISLMLTTRRLI